MNNQFKPIDSLVDDIKANTNFVGRIINPRLKLFLLIVGFGIIAVISLIRF